MARRGRCNAVLARVKAESSHTASLAANAAAIYSASVEDAATIACRLLAQLITPPTIKNTFPDVDLRVSLSSAQSESE